MKPSVFPQRNRRIALFRHLNSAGSASQSEAMTVGVGFSPRRGSAKTGRRGATLEGIDWLFRSGVAPRRASFPHHYSVGSSPRLPSRSRCATSQKVRHAPTKRAHLDTATGAPTSGPARSRQRSIKAESETGAPFRVIPVVVVSRCAPTKHTVCFVVDGTLCL